MIYRKEETRAVLVLLSKKSRDMVEAIDIKIKGRSGGEVKVECVLCGPGSEGGKGWELIKLSTERMEYKKMKKMIEAIGNIFTFEKGESLAAEMMAFTTEMTITLRTKP